MKRRSIEMMDKIRSIYWDKYDGFLLDYGLKRVDIEEHLKRVYKLDNDFVYIDNLVDTLMRLNIV